MHMVRIVFFHYKRTWFLLVNRIFLLIAPKKALNLRENESAIRSLLAINEIIERQLIDWCPVNVNNKINSNGIQIILSEGDCNMECIDSAVYRKDVTATISICLIQGFNSSDIEQSRPRNPRIVVIRYSFAVKILNINWGDCESPNYKTFELTFVLKCWTLLNSL